MNFAKSIAASLAFAAALVSTSQAEQAPLEPALVATGPGGSVVEFAQRVSIARMRNTHVRFSGQCASACTLFLSLPASHTCITPGATFTFHRASGATAELNAWGTEYLMERYPGWVRTWIRARGGLSDRLLRMDYAYAAQFIPACDRDQAAATRIRS